MIKAAIIGATGYTGLELVKLLYDHPDIEVDWMTSESHAGKRYSEIHPQFLNIVDQILIPSGEVPWSDVDACFLALPHGVSMHHVAHVSKQNVKMVDLSGDFRLSSAEVFEQWYQMEHTYPEGFQASTYGMPELHAASIAKKNLVANPGCFPTSAILALAPLANSGWIPRKGTVIDSKTGVTGAGIKPQPTTHFSSVNDNFFAYKLKNHRHTIEIEEQVGLIQNHTLTVQFTPHLLPVDRGILSTVYVPVGENDISESQLRKIYSDFYNEAPFVRLRQDPPDLKNVRGTNYCDISVHLDKRTDNIIVLSAIDNLVKGAAGQAIQNMNIMMGLDQSTGLKQIPLKP